MIELQHKLKWSAAGLLIAGLAACGASDQSSEETMRIEQPASSVESTDAAVVEPTDAPDPSTATDSPDGVSVEDGGVELARDADEDHDHDDHGDHGSHSEVESHEDHDHHDDHGQDHADHDHDEHDHAGGEAHTHGNVDAALVIDGGDVSLTFDTALASLGASEAEPQTPEAMTALDDLRQDWSQFERFVSFPEAAQCRQVESASALRYSGDHGSAEITFEVICDGPEALDSLAFSAFVSYPTIEEITAVVLSGESQTATTHTPVSPALQLTP